jgi:hypothetical protein
MSSLILCNLILLAAPAPAPSAPPDQALLPPSGFLQTWKRSEKVRVFTSSDLYGYIDGGAEIFLEFGFEQLTVQPYTSDFRPSASREQAGEFKVEIYRMKDPTAAAGIYFMNCGKEAPDPSFSERHTLNDFQLLFKRDRYYVIVNNVEGEKNLKAAMLEFGRFIASHLPAQQPVRADEILPRTGLDKSSIRLIRGPYALQAIYILGEGDILQLNRQITAVSGTYEEPAGKSTLILVEYPDEPGARRAFLNVQRNLDSYLKVEDNSDQRIVFKDSSGQYGVISMNGKRLSVRVHLSKKP